MTRETLDKNFLIKLNVTPLIKQTLSDSNNFLAKKKLILADLTSQQDYVVIKHVAIKFTCSGFLTTLRI